MSPESSGSKGLEDATWPDEDDWPEDDSPDDDWPDDEPDKPQEPGLPWPGGPGRPSEPGAPAYGGGGGPPRGRVRPLALTAVALVALAVGAGVAAVVARGVSSPPAAAPAPSSSAPFGAPGGGNGNGGNGPPPGGGGAVGQLFIGGKVTAVSSTSITIGAGGHAVTAAVTSSTRVTGNVTSIGSVKVGDLVSAQITESGGHATATAIQDPAHLPSSGGGLP